MYENLNKYYLHIAQLSDEEKNFILEYVIKFLLLINSFNSDSGIIDLCERKYRFDDNEQVLIDIMVNHYDKDLIYNYACTFLDINHGNISDVSNGKFLLCTEVIFDFICEENMPEIIEKISKILNIKLCEEKFSQTLKVSNMLPLDIVKFDNVDPAFIFQLPPSLIYKILLEMDNYELAAICHKNSDHDVSIITRCLPYERRRSFFKYLEIYRINGIHESKLNEIFYRLTKVIADTIGAKSA